MSKPVLYVFGHSVWAAAPQLALIELGYPKDSVRQKVVNLIKGENFHPDFIKLNKEATLPTLEADGQVFTNTTDVTAYLVKNATTSVRLGSSLIARIHEDNIDPNFAMLCARNEEELTANGAGVPGAFLTSRQAALDRYSQTHEGNQFRAFYNAKLAANGGLLSFYDGSASEEAKQEFFKKSSAVWDNIRAFILDTLTNMLPESGFIGGDRPGEDDFHVGAWLARIASLSGVENAADDLAVLENELGEPIPEKLAAYWSAWSERPSWKEVYAPGLH